MAALPPSQWADGYIPTIDDWQGAFSLLNGNYALSTIALALAGAVARTAQDRAGDYISVRDFGICGIGNDDTVVVQRAFDSGRNIDLGEIVLKTSNTLYVRTPNQRVVGRGPNTSIIFQPGVVIQPMLIVTQAAYNSQLDGISFNHQGSLFPQPSTFYPGILGKSGVAGDARGVAVLIMADGHLLQNCFCFNGWDNGFSWGNWDLDTGAQSAGPDHARAVACFGFNNGAGAHSWGYAPGGSYRQGCGFDVLGGTNFIGTGCHDYGSAGGFWFDSDGGAHGVWASCTSIGCLPPVIWSDAAGGGNQMWYTEAFGGTITGPGAGWKKTPGGVAFFSGSYGGRFDHCTAYYPGMIGFAFDQNSSANIVTGCRVVASQCAGVVDAGLGNSFNGITLEGCCTATGTTSSTGSVCPTFGAFEAVGQAADYVNTQIAGLVIRGSPAYPGQASELVYPYAIYARKGTVSGAPSKISALGTLIKAGTQGIVFTDPGCSVGLFSGAGAVLEFDSYGALPAFNVNMGNVPGFQISQDASGDVGLTSYLAGKSISLSQSGGGTVVIGTNGQPRLVVGQTLQVLDAPNYASGIPAGTPSGTLYVGAGNALMLSP